MDYVVRGYIAIAAAIAARDGWRGLERTFRSDLLTWLVGELKHTDEIPEAWKCLREEVAKAACQGRPWALR